ncbi:Platz transcription factor family protein [Thalictrum thalictroides]|uniref:Platz transcription factor family protein n=1 Tax=Thalictrum thalictroides TaxID=46969 RepID=A0A7J6X4J5_THATH|nr:Platz transcription factor family protein [Thalictrum thalictroides]
MVNYSVLPHWLATLLREKFFSPCLVHETVKKNEKNIFCLDCCLSICPHCLSPHNSHRLLQIRRYVYHDVIRLDDCEKLIDCDFVQCYTTNSARVLFINQRSQTRPFRGSGNICSTCDRSLQDPNLFCSLACKVAHLVKSEGGISRHLYECEFLPLSEGLDDGQMTPDSVLESPDDSSSSTNGGGGGSSGVDCCRTLACTTTTEIVKKKRSSLSARNSYRPTCSTASEIAIVMNRRKGNPQRSPLY